VTNAAEVLPRPVGGILFDYGETLVEFSRPEAALAQAEQRIRDVLAASGHEVPSATVLRGVHDRVEREVAEYQRGGGLEEMDPAEASFRAYTAAGVSIDSSLLDELLRIEQEAWWHGARLDPEAIPLLDALRDRGIRVGLCSNAPYRVASLHAQLAFVGLAGHLDSVTFSAEVGWRKPSPRIFEAAMDALGTHAGNTVMVGDSEPADITGAHATGMRAVLLRRDGERGSGDADAVIAALRQLPGALRNMGIYLD
jgi:putative hydrolase of the HAD superfamily